MLFLQVDIQTMPALIQEILEVCHVVIVWSLLILLMLCVLRLELITADPPSLLRYLHFKKKLFLKCDMQKRPDLIVILVQSCWRIVYETDN